MRRAWLTGMVFTFLASGAANAHSFGTPYVLPIPLWLYMYGAAATLVVTFAVMGYFATAPTPLAPATLFPAATVTPSRSFDTPWRYALSLLRAGALGGLLLVILTGLTGPSDPENNISGTLFWSFLFGFTYLTAVAGDLFALLNPWRTVAHVLERVGVDLSTARLPYPRRFAYWPAFLFYVGLIWIELFGSPEPRSLSLTLLTYSGMTLLGVAVFGKDAWFRYGEVFSVLFRLVGRLAPVEYREGTGTAPPGMILRRPLAGVLSGRPEHISLVAFVIFMLSSTSYDGIHNTSLWIGLFWTNVLWFLQPIWGTDLGRAQDVLMDWFLLYRQAGILVFLFLYGALYFAIVLLAKWVSRSTVPFRALAFNFCFALIPIAVAYHFTHYYPFLVNQLSQLPSLAVDTLKSVWDVSGVPQERAAVTLDMGVVWHIQVGVILAGHIAGAWAAHQAALRTFATRRQANVSQLPFLFLMVFYTIVGLWILSLPLGMELR